MTNPDLLRESLAIATERERVAIDEVFNATLRLERANECLAHCKRMKHQAAQALEAALNGTGV